MLLPNRHGSVDSDSYRYGFQGQEKDDEVKGEGNSYNYTFRMHDPRLVRFFAVDPLSPKYAMLTPYQFASNSLISKGELEGLEGGWVIENGCAKYEKGPVLNAYSSKEAAIASQENSKKIVNNKPPQLSQRSVSRFTMRAQTEHRDVLARRKAHMEYLQSQQELMKWTYTVPGMQVAHGVYVGLPEGLMEVSGVMVVDKAIDGYRAYKMVRSMRFVDDIVIHAPLDDAIQHSAKTEKVGEIINVVRKNSAKETVGGSFLQLGDDGVTITGYRAADWVKKGARGLTIEGKAADNIIYAASQTRSASGLTTLRTGLTTTQKAAAVGLGGAGAYGSYRLYVEKVKRDDELMKSNLNMIKRYIQDPNGNNQ